MDAQIKEYNTKQSTKANTYDDTQNNTNTTPTAPQLQNLGNNHPLSLVTRNFKTSRSNYPQSLIQHIITQQPSMKTHTNKL